MFARWSKGLLWLGVTVLLWGCSADPVPELWPPSPGKGQSVFVYCDGFHSAVVIPRGPQRFQELAFMEKSWCLQGSQGCWGRCRAVGWPSAGLLESRGLLAWPSAETHQAAGLPFRRWHFVVSSQGLSRIRQAFEDWKARDLPVHEQAFDQRAYYDSVHSYYLWNTCHTFTAHMLRAAGLPISPHWLASENQIMARLDEVAQWHKRLNLTSTP